MKKTPAAAVALAVALMLPGAELVCAGLQAEPLGDAWSDVRNPVVKAFRGQRLDLWSLQKVRPVIPPRDDAGGWATTDLDRFTAAELKRESLIPPPAAEARTLARRMFFDLTGLPPSTDRMELFVREAERGGLDTAATALTEELLASPRFGEQMARMWLDVARYSDSNGFDWDEWRPEAWRFRDYVVQAFNEDKPYYTFLTEQLAGDELVAAETPPAEADILHAATGFLRSGPWDNSARLFNEQDRARSELLTDLTETTGSAFLGLTLGCCRCHDHKYDPLTQADHYRMRAFFAAVKFEEPFQIRDNPKHIPATFVLGQGDYRQEKESVEPGFPSVLDPNAADIPQPPDAAGTGRRLALARWIASPDNPFTDRVMVNRLWQMLMPHPLVETANDFGLAGSPPLDAALLDWLAGEFRRGGGSVKSMVRLLTASATYRQAAGTGTEAARFPLRQPRRLSAEQLRDAALSVAGLLTDKSGGAPVWPDLPQELILANPAFLDDNKEKTKGWYASPPEDQGARSLFLIQKRNTRVPVLETFDLPDNSTSCARRGISTVAPQALTWMNGPLMAQAAAALALRAEQRAGGSPGIDAVWQLALQRAPTPTEREAAENFLTRRTLPELCRVVLNLNEFIYLD